MGIQRSRSPNPQLKLSGPYNSRAAYDARTDKDVAIFLGSEVLAWNDSASLPLLPTTESVGIFSQLRRAPRLDLDQPEQWRALPHRELDATIDKEDKKTGEVLMDLTSQDCPDGFWPVFKGRSFDLWDPDRGRETYYAWADPNVMLPRNQAKRIRGSKNKRSVFNKCSPQWISDVDTLPCLSPRIAFRDITNRTNRRTVIASLLPPRVFVTNKGPYLIFPRGTSMDVVFVLGVLSSIPLDWYARRFVEVNLNFFIFNPFPVPRPSLDNSLRQRVIELAGRLACPDDRFADWAKEVGVECGSLEEDEKQDMIQELDAVVAHLYGLTRDHLAHIFETFHVGCDYQTRLDATLKHFAKWKSKS